jgi:hypothetical protein
MFERPEVNHSKKTSELRCRVWFWLCYQIDLQDSPYSAAYGVAFVDSKTPPSSNILGFYRDYASGRWWAMISGNMDGRGILRRG